MLFSDNFDYQHLKRDFVSGVLSEEELGNKVHLHTIKVRRAAVLCCCYARARWLGGACALWVGGSLEASCCTRADARADARAAASTHNTNNQPTNHTPQPNSPSMRRASTTCAPMTPSAATCCSAGGSPLSPTPTSSSGGGHGGPAPTGGGGC